VGFFYTSVTVRGPLQTEVISALESLEYRAFIGPTLSTLTVICEQGSDTQDKAIWHRVAQQVSEKLSCQALAVMNHHDDILTYALYAKGALMDEYNSCPSYWNATLNASQPLGGDAEMLCNAFGMSGDAAEVERILRHVPDCDEDADTEEEFVFEWERHAALLRALNWPEIPYQQGFDYLIKDLVQSAWRLIG
jgi:hypothetical protein